MEDTEEIFTGSYETQETAEKPEKAVIVQNMKVSNTDPSLMRDEYSKEIVPLVYETLFRLNPKGEIKNCLVEKYEWLSERKLYLKLKPKIFFHDGTELTASDVKNSLDFLRKNGVLKNMYSDITDIKVLGKDELTIKISEEDNTFLNTLAYRMSSIAKREGENIYGTGQYKIEEFTGKEIVLKSFENYHGTIPELKEISYTWEIDGKQRLINLFNDYADIALNLEEETIKDGQQVGIISDENIILPSEVVVTKVVIFGEQNNFSFDMKKAFEKSLNRKADSFFPKEFLNARLSKIDISQDKKEMKKLLENTGEKPEFRLMILNTENNMKIAQEIKKSLKDVGINVKILPHQIEAYNAKLISKDFDLALFDITILNNDLVFLMNKILLTDIENAELYNALQPFFKIVKDEKDKEKRDAVIDKMASLIHKNIPYVIMEHHRYFTVISPDFEELFKDYREI